MLADPQLRAALVRAVRRRVPPAEVDDVVQSTLAEALSAETAPEAAGEFERWVYGIAHHKCADYFRRTRREAPSPEVIEQAAATDSSRQSAEEWLKWAHRELPPGEQADRTLEWMLREASGEKLESIAADEKIPAPRVRQRVVRMRRHFRGRWAAQLAAIVAAIALGVTAAFLLRGRGEQEARRIEPEPVGPAQEAAELRRIALEQCRRAEWQRCVAGLDAAKQLDADGERLPEVKQARQAAGRVLAPAPVLPTPGPSQAPIPEPSEDLSPAPPAPSTPLLLEPKAPARKEPAPKKAEPTGQKGEPSEPAPWSTEAVPQVPIRAPSNAVQKQSAKPSSDDFDHKGK